MAKSLRIYSKNEPYKKNKKYKFNYHEQKKNFLNFKNKIFSVKKKIIEFVRNNSFNGKIVIGLGAATKGNTLLQYYGIDSKMISFASERSPEKWGKYTIGTGVEIISEEYARKLNPEYFFVMPYAFIKEFVIREKKWLKKGGKFILPYPNFKVLNK